MTVTDQRWWAPAAPGIGPDEFDLELLTPGDDPKADLGQAFLALHRVGAAACEAVAAQPLADENALAFALINARQQVAPEASEIISKSVGDNPNYGNLLIRDLLDDAEASALSLWRSCIAKGVPTSVTAKRVGMVYGLPPGELYAFQKHATDPKAQPPALQEAADKALFTHVAKLVADEAVERKVEVSKQRPRGARAERWWEGEARNAEGEWTAEETTEGDVEPAEPAAVPRRAQRAQRARRAQRAERISVTERVSEGAGESVGESVGSSVGEGVGVSALFGVGGPVGELLNDLPPNPNFDPGVSNLSRVPRTPPDPTKPYLAQEHGRYIDNPLAFVMPSDEWQSFLKDSGQGEIGRTFYAGRLQEYIGLPTVFQSEGVDKTTDEHEAVVRQVAHKVNKGMDPVRAHRIDYQPDFGEPELANETLRWMQEELGMSQMEAAREMVHVDFLADLKNPTHSMYAVYTPRPRGRPRDAERPVPQVTEVVAIDDEGLFGELVQRGGKEQWQINRGLSMTTAGAFGSRNKRFWDDKNRVIRNQVIVQTTDEKVSKALSPERFHQLEEEGRIARDESGEFAPAQAPPTRARRAVRAQRARRLVPRPVGDVGVSAGESVGESVGDRAVAASAERASDDVRRPRVEAPDDPDLLTFAEDYHTAVPAHVHVGFGFHRKTPNEEARREIDRPGVAFGDEIHSHVAGVTIDKFNDHGGREVLVFHNSKAAVEDLSDLASAIHTEMAKDENYTLARVKMRLRADGTASIEVYRNQRPLGTVDVIRWEDANKIRPYRLYPDEQGRYQTEKTIKYWLETAWDSAERADNHTDDKQLANPWVRVWRAEQV